MKMTELEPKAIFHYFNEICKVPRPSKKEERMTEWLLKTGKELGLESKRDKAGNVLISKPATKGKENVTPVIFQAHMDMVCEKNNDTKFDFEKDAIQAYVDGEWLKAKGTTLGADDGIGVAIALAFLADKKIKHGPIECLFTVDEETGLTGAFALEPGFMTGKILLNLDSEDWGEIFIGCAGGKDTVATYECEYEDEIPEDSVAYKVTVGGLLGGHSGDDINKNRGNAVKLLNRILWNAYQEYDARIADINAGNLRNAIAREGWAIVTMPKGKAAAFRKYVAKVDADFKNEFQRPRCVCRMQENDQDAGTHYQRDAADRRDERPLRLSARCAGHVARHPRLRGDLHEPRFREADRRQNRHHHQPAQFGGEPQAGCMRPRGLCFLRHCRR